MDGNGTARVGDLGLARLWNGFVEGTPHSANYHWMAPEVIYTVVVPEFAPQHPDHVAVTMQSFNGKDGVL